MALGLCPLLNFNFIPYTLYFLKTFIIPLREKTFFVYPARRGKSF